MSERHAPPRLSDATEEPDLATEKEAAAWFDATDTSRLPGDEVGPQPSGGAQLQTVSVRLSKREIDELKRRAERLGIGYTSYLRMLVNRHVLDEPPIH